MEKTLKKTVKHIQCVQSMIQLVLSNLQSRQFHHDQSKFSFDELKGYERFEDMPEGLEYGSPEHKEAMAKVMKDNDCFDLHVSRNDHHPEHFIKHHPVGLEAMGFLPIIEMVCDWAGAMISYGNKGGWFDGVGKNVAKYAFSPGQRWLIYEVSDFLYENVEALRTDDPRQGVHDAA